MTAGILAQEDDLYDEFEDEDDSDDVEDYDEDDYFDDYADLNHTNVNGNAVREDAGTRRHSPSPTIPEHQGNVPINFSRHG